MKLYNKFAKGLPSVAGKVFVITGTTSGTGFIAAECVAKKGGEVVLLNRPSERADASLEKLRAAVPDAKFVSIPCDLQDLASVRTACAAVQEKYDTIYCLSNNAGVMALPDEATKDGYDIQMQTNHLSHFLITQQLFPLIANGAKKFGDARIVQHSSGARQMTAEKGLAEKYFGPNGGNLGGTSTNGAMSGPNMDRYAQTKLANAVFSYALHDKLQEKEEYVKIKAVAAHPGFARTSLYGLDLGRVGTMLMPLADKILFQSSEDGAMGLIKGMMDPDAESGHLYGPKWISGTAVSNPPKSYETDTASKKMLWETSENAIGEKFDI